jgi:transcription factor SFP1
MRLRMTSPVEVEFADDLSYEEEHAGVVPDVRMMNAAANPNAAPGGPGPRPSFSMPNANANGSAYNPQIAGMQQSHGHGDAPTPPGMMDIEMDEPSAPSHAFMSSPLGRPGLPGGVPPQSSPGLWATAFRPQFPNVGAPPPQCVPPSLLSFSSATPQQGLGTSSAPPSAPSTPAPRPPTQEELEAKALRKAQRKAERMAAREEASASDAEHEKKFPCPIEGCGKVYKQANGLKYHLTRSINSGHGNVAAMGGITALLGEKAGTHVDIKG